MTSKIFKTLTKSNNDADFVAAIADIKKRGKSLQLDIQSYLVAVGARWAETGDVRPAVPRINMLLADMPTGVRSNAIKTWVEAFFGMVIVDDPASDKHGKFVAGKRKHTELDVPAMSAVANHWYTFTPEPEYIGLNLDDMIAMVLKKADARIKKGLKDADNIDSAKLDALREMVPSKAEAVGG